MEVPEGLNPNSFSELLEGYLSISSSFPDDPNVSAAESDLHLSSKPRSLLQYFREKRVAVLGSRIPFELPLDIEIPLYDRFISQLEYMLICTKERERDLFER